MNHINVAFVGFKGTIHGLIRLVQKLEQLGIDSVSIPDDLYLRDVYSTIAVLANTTERIALSFITNPYSRHPVLIARAIATLMELAPSRIRLELCAGGSFTLKPLNIPMWHKPVSRLRETIQICRQLFTGENLIFKGKIFSIQDVKFQFPFPHEQPYIGIMGRGPRVLSLAGELADGVSINPISPFYEQTIIEKIMETARRNNRNTDDILISTTVTYTHEDPEKFAQKARHRIVNVIHDMPLPLLRKFYKDLSDDIMKTIEKIHAAPSIDAAASLVTDEIVNLYPDTVFSQKELISSLEQRMKRGYNGIAIVAPPGEEQLFVQQLNKDLVDTLHHIH
ncbi:MAG: LLM class flavin-dependent oxidoreductase [Candidatus Ranarchaeia archaeon]